MRLKHPSAWVVTTLVVLSGFTIYRLLSPHAAKENSVPQTRQLADSAALPERPSAGPVKIANTVPSSRHTNSSPADLYHCHAKLLRVMSARSTLSSCESSNLSPNAYNSCQLTRAADEQRNSELEAAASGCPRDALEPKKFYAAVRDRALSGDVQAQRCYIGGEFGGGSDTAIIDLRTQLLTNPGIKAAVTKGSHQPLAARTVPPKRAQEVLVMRTCGKR